MGSDELQINQAHHSRRQRLAEAAGRALSEDEGRAPLGHERGTSVGRDSSDSRAMERKEKLQTVGSRGTIVKPRGKEPNKGRNVPLGPRAVSKRKRTAYGKAPLDAAQSANLKESKNSNVEETSVRSDRDSDSDSDDGSDELQFIGGANSDDGSDSGSYSSSGEAEKEVEASFELFDPQEEDAAALLLLLRHSRVYSQLDLQPHQFRGLAEVIAGQGNIGSVARAASEAEGRSSAAVGLMTLISVKQYPEAMGPIVSKILSLAQAHASDKISAELRKLLDLAETSTTCSKKAKDGTGEGTSSAKINTALFISCRFTNLPLEVAAEAAEALAEDVQWSLTTPDMDEEERPWYRFSHVIGVTLVYRDTKAQETPKKQKQSLRLEFEQAVLSEGAVAAFAAPTNQALRFSSLPSDKASKNRDTRKHKSVMQTLQEYLLVYAIPHDRFELNQRKVKQRLAVEAAVRSS